MFKILDTGASTATENMQQDGILLNELGNEFGNDPILHLYDWKGDSATYGYFIKPEKFINIEIAQKRGLHLAKRPTGGGIVFHTIDFAFSLLVPISHPWFSLNPLDNYHTVHAMVGKVLTTFTGQSMQFFQGDAIKNSEETQKFCMANPSRYDLLFEGKKVGGAAQRMTKKGFLHQGSILLRTMPESYRDFLSESVYDTTIQKSWPLLEKSASKDLTSARSDLKSLFIKELKDLS